MMRILIVIVYCLCGLFFLPSINSGIHHGPWNIVDLFASKIKLGLIKLYRLFVIYTKLNFNVAKLYYAIYAWKEHGETRAFSCYYWLCAVRHWITFRTSFKTVLFEATAKFIDVTGSQTESFRWNHGCTLYTATAASAVKCLCFIHSLWKLIFKASLFAGEV